MRGVCLGLVFLVFVSTPFAFSKKKDFEERTEPTPLFMDPEFQFSQVQAICLPPVLDLRVDKAKVPGLPDLRTGLFDRTGRQTTPCGPVSATLSELSTPSDAFLHKLDFGQSNWLFILAVESIEDFHKTTHTRSDAFTVLSGFLFEKKAGSVRLVWWNRGVGVSGNVTSPELWGTERKREADTVADMASSTAIAVNRLLGPFSPPGKHTPIPFAFHEEDFDEPCDAVWTVFKTALSRDPKKRNTVLLDDSNKMAIYMVGHRKLAGILYDEDDVALKAQSNGCRMQVQVNTVLHFGHHPTVLNDNYIDLIKEMRASLTKR